MNVNSPFESVLSYELNPGRLVQLQSGGRTAIGMIVAWQTDEKCCLVLEGEEKGTLTRDMPPYVQALKEPLTIEFPGDSSAWIGQHLPQNIPLSVAVGKDRACFVFVHAGQYHAADVETGRICGRPAQANYLSEWEIWPDGMKWTSPICMSRNAQSLSR